MREIKESYKKAFIVQMEKLGIQKTSESETKLIEGQRWIFLVTFLNYALAHWTR